MRGDRCANHEPRRAAQAITSSTIRRSQDESSEGSRLRGSADAVETSSRSRRGIVQGMETIRRPRSVALSPVADQARTERDERSAPRVRAHPIARACGGRSSRQFHSGARRDPVRVADRHPAG